MPTKVLEAGAQAFVNYEKTGLSLAEISHRSSLATKILNDTKSALSSILGMPDSHEILFLHGGGTGEFSAVVFNMVAVWVEQRRRRAEKELDGDEEKILERVRKELREELKLDYLVTGSWSLKASQEAANLLEPLGKGFTNVAMDARKTNDGKFGTIPGESTWNLTPTRGEGGTGSAFVYYCDNETVDGVEFPKFPECLEPQGQGEDDERLVVADMSSNFLSRHIDVRKYAVIFVSIIPIRWTNLVHIYDSTHGLIGWRTEEHRYNRHHHSHRPQISSCHISLSILSPCSRSMVTTSYFQLGHYCQKQFSL